VKKLSIILLSLFFLVLLRPADGLTFFWDNYLVKIDNQKYTKEDFLKWWNFWKEPGMKIPDTPDPFINWILLSREGEALALNEDPYYKHKMRVFLSVRSLLLLKNEEVDSKIEISQNKIWKEYLKDYVPRLKIISLVTNNEKEAKKWQKEIKSKEDFEKLFEKLKKEGKAKDFGWERPITIPKEIRQSVINAKPGDILLVNFHNNYFLVLVQDKKGPEKEDFEALTKSISHKLRKKEEEKLTNDLLERLKRKYQVKVYWSIIDQIGNKELPKELAKQIVLEIQGEKLTAGQFYQKLQKEISLRFPNKKINKEELERLKRYMINTYIAQTLTSLEALNRHYETKEPLKDLYEFYKKQLLINTLEEKIIKPQIKITEDEIKKYYEEHIKDFTRPEMVQIAVIKTTDPALIKKAYQRLKSGEDFFEVGKEIQFHGVRPEKYPLSRLVPEMKEVVVRLKPGTFSPIIKFKRGDETWYCIVYLLRHYPEEPHPYNMVKESIEKMLYQQKFQKLKEDYIKKLRANAHIEINQKAWEEVHKELEAENAKRHKKF